MPERKYDLAFFEVRVDLGLTLGQIEELANRLDFYNEDGGRMLSTEIENPAGNSVAIGYMPEHIAAELNFRFDKPKKFIQKILGDMGLESKDNSYQFDGFSVYLSRP